MGRTLTIQQAADKLQVRPNTVRRWIRRGRIPGCKIGRIFRIPEEELERVLSGRSAENSMTGRSEAERAAIIRALRGRYSAVPGTVEDFLRERHEESHTEEQSQ